MYYKNKYIVYGRVQGVGFRRFAQRCAKEYSIGGYVKNLSDGSVEIEAIGEKNQLEAFISKMYQGSWFSDVENIERVTSVQVEEIDFPEFSIIRSW